MSFSGFLIDLPDEFPQLISIALRSITGFFCFQGERERVYVIQDARGHQRNLQTCQFNLRSGRLAFVVADHQGAEALHPDHWHSAHGWQPDVHPRIIL